MNVKPYLFRITVTATAFFVAIAATNTFQKADQFSQYWLGRAANAMKTMFIWQPGAEASSHYSKGQKVRAPGTFTGEYFLSEDEFPSGFSDFDHIQIAAYDDKGNHLLLRHGAVYANSIYNISKISVDSGDVSFETESRAGISYRFEGRMLVTDERFYKGSIGDLIGKLEKLENDCVVAKTQTTFYHFAN